MHHILHLSDLHFGNCKNAETWHEQLAADLKYKLNCHRISVLILSGDISNTSSVNEYKAASKFVQKLSDDFHIHRKNTIIVPGNHDHNWDISEKAYEQNLVFLKIGKDKDQSNLITQFKCDHCGCSSIPDNQEYYKRFKNFSDFYKGIIGESYPLEPEDQGIVYYIADMNFLILGLNSAWHLDNFYHKRVGINDQAVTRALSKIQETAQFKNCLKIAVWHHPVNIPSEVCIKDHGFLGRLTQAGFCFALHGHIHKSERGHFNPPIDRKIELIAAGTFGAPPEDWKPGHPLQYNLIKYEGSHFTVETRKKENPSGAWGPHAIWGDESGNDPKPRYRLEIPPGSFQGGCVNRVVDNNKLKNPFEIGEVPVTDPKLFFGRKKETEEYLRYVLESRVSLVSILGLNSVGISSFLNYVRNKDIFQNQNTQNDPITVFVNIYGRKSPPDFYSHLYNEIYKKIHNKPPKKENNLFSDLPDLVNELIKKYRPQKIIIQLSEFDDIRRREEFDVDFFKRLSQIIKNNNNAIWITTSYYPFKEIIKYGTSLGRSKLTPNKIMYMPGLDDHEAEEFLRTTANRNNIPSDIYTGMMKDIIEIGGTFPILLIETAKLWFEENQKRKKMDPNEIIKKLLCGKAGEIFNDWWGCFDDKEKNMLKQLAIDGDLPIEKAGNNNEIDRLQKYGVIVKKHGMFRMNGELFSKWIRRKYQPT